MKHYIRPFIVAVVILTALSFMMLCPRAQEKSKEIAATKPSTVDVPFSPSDAIEINKLRVIREDTDRKIGEILTSYGGEGEVLLDGKGNYIGIRKTVKKP